MPLAPRLFIVAGPNGSGKSLFSRQLTLTDVEVFDGDKRMAELVKSFPETGSEALWPYINDHIFKEEKQKAISGKLSYAFETNFSSDGPMQSAYEFKKAGYEIHLIFMGLNSLEESTQRVAQRVRNGGHKVSPQSIRYNYEHGYKNLYKYFTEFDSVTLFDNAIAYPDKAVTPKQILYIAGDMINIETAVYPDWVKPVIKHFDEKNNS